MSQSAEGEVRFETALQETGQPATVVRDGEGQLLYPGFVPPAPQSPGTPSPLQTSSAGLTPSATSPARSAPVTRPKLTGKSASDAPRPVRRQSSAVPLPSIKRAGTNASQLQHALWTRSYHANDSSSSDSSSDEDDEGGPSDGIARTDHATGNKAPGPQKAHRFRVANDKYTTKGKVSKRDGRLSISIKDTSNDNYLPKALSAAISKVVPLKKGEIAAKPAPGEPHATPFKTSDAFLTPESFQCPRLNIVIMVIGSRGDAQPFLKIGKVLKEKYGHRVRIATHPAFREFVEQDSGLEFFSVGGDPSELMAFMVKNPGLIPTIETLRAGDIGRRRAAMNEMFGGFWRACVNASDDEKDVRNLRMMGKMPPFVADAIIANPASFAHVHCAEALGIPLILSFTFPYTPTRSFPHPMANVKRSNVDPGYTNFISYPLVEMMIWQGLGDLVNDLRVKTLGLDPVSTLWAPGALYRMNVPFAYLWSPSLVPKPPDWGEEIDICGFVFLDLASSFTPPDPLEKFLSAGETPIYIGFGSIVVDDANSFTKMIFEAVKLAGVRALVSKGWGGLGGDDLDVPENIFLLDNTPHDWLFPRVRACVIHGGAGTTAIALKCGKPTMVVPFFGDQFFWGNMISRAKAGPEPVPYKQLSVEKLAEGIQFCLTKEAQENAHTLASDIAREGDGADNMCAFFHNHLTLSGKHSIRCSIFEDRVAVWHMKGTSLRLSALAADILVARGYVQWRKLRLIRHCEWNDFEGPGEPVTGVLGSVATSLGETFGGIASVPAQIAKHSHKKRRKQQRKSEEQQGRVSTSQQKQEAQKQTELAADSRKDSKVEKDPSDKLPMPNGDGPRDVNTLNDTASGTTLQNPSPQTEGTEYDTYVSDVGRGALKSARALASAPIDLSIALAQGFHNAPRLYGDDTVRRPPRVTGIKSGLRAARSEFTYGFYDAWTGVVRLPVRGAKKDGAKGFAKGIGMGLSGLILKELAAITGPFGYTLKGLKKQAGRRKQPYKQVRRARILQGQIETKGLSEQERRRRVYEVERSWLVLKNLMEAVEKQGKEKGSMSVQLSIRRHLAGEAYESVQMAESVLEAVRRGQDIKDVMQRCRGPESAEVA